MGWNWIRFFCYWFFIGMKRRTRCRVPGATPHWGSRTMDTTKQASTAKQHRNPFTATCK